MKILRSWTPISSEAPYWASLSNTIDHLLISINTWKKIRTIRKCAITGGLTLVNLSKYEEALADFNRTLELNPDFERAYRARGNVRIQLGDQKGGDEDLKEWERRSGLPGK